MTTNDRDNDGFEALLRHVVRTAPMEEPPQGFAQWMSRRVTGHPENAGIESWLTRIALWATVIATAGFAVLYIIRAGARILELMGDAPWPLLLSVLAIFGGVKLMEVVPLPTRHLN